MATKKTNKQNFNDLVAQATELAESATFTVGKTDGQTEYDIEVKSTFIDIEGKEKSRKRAYTEEILSVLMYRELNTQLAKVKGVDGVLLDALFDATKSDKDNGQTSEKFNYFRVIIPAVFGEKNHLQIRRHPNKADRSRVRFSVSPKLEARIDALAEAGLGVKELKVVKGAVKRVYLYVSFDQIAEAVKAFIAYKDEEENAEE